MPNYLSATFRGFNRKVTISIRMISLSRACAASTLPTTTGYVTDVEGNYDYWQRYLAISRVIDRTPSTGTLKLKDSCSLVYGGDVCDRGPGDLRVLSDLISLQREYPDRVHLILGNRDINKLRLDIELHPAKLARKGKVYWIPEGTKEETQSANDRLRWVCVHKSQHV